MDWSGHSRNTLCNMDSSRPTSSNAESMQSSSNQLAAAARISVCTNMKQYHASIRPLHSSFESTRSMPHDNRNRAASSMCAGIKLKSAEADAAVSRSTLVALQFV